MKHGLIILLILSVSSMALAQPSASFPSSVQLSHEGTTYRAFDLGGFRALLRIDADLAAAVAELTLRRQQVTELTQAVENHQQAVAVLEHTQTVLQAERDRLTLQWRDADAALQNCEHKPRLAPFLGWALAATLFLVSSGLTVYIVLR